MFDYRFTRNAVEYTEGLRKEAHARLARGQPSGLARFVARTFRSWANRLTAATGPWKVQPFAVEATFLGYAPLEPGGGAGARGVLEPTPARVRGAHIALPLTVMRTSPAKATHRGDHQ